MLEIFSFVRNRNKKKIEKYLNEGCLILDVRSESEFRGGHFKNSVNIPIDSLPKFIGQLDKSRYILTCCATGTRSVLAKHMLKARGFKVVNGGSWTNLREYEE